MLPCSAGIGLRAPHVRAALDGHPAIRWIEIHSENVFGGGPAGQLVRELAERYPLSLHGVGMGLGAVEPLDAEHLRALTTLVRAMHPSAVYNVRLGGATAPPSVLFAVLAFAFIYMVSIVSMTLLLAFTGLDIVTAFSAVVASVNNTGPGLGLVGPATTFAVLEDFQTWVCIYAMLLGRLEIFTLLVVLTPAFWRK